MISTKADRTYGANMGGGAPKRIALIEKGWLGGGKAYVACASANEDPNLPGGPRRKFREPRPK